MSNLALIKFIHFINDKNAYYMKWQPLVSIPSYCKKTIPNAVTSLSHSSSHNRLSLLLVKSFIALLAFSNLYAQNNTVQQQQDYLLVIKTRSEKIVNVLALNDSHKYNTVVNELMSQYSTINTIHEQNKVAIDQIKQRSAGKEEVEAGIRQQEDKKSELLKQQHSRFIAQLTSNLTADQVEKVKDAMTYRVFPITYAGYLDMLTSLTEEQKNQIYAWLKEARELAMDAESSEKKHAVFGKYKGRINNYLSKAGYDMNKESKAWQERIKERQKTN